MPGDERKYQEVTILEALLFTSADSLSIERLSGYLEISKEEVLFYLKELSKEYETHNSALTIKRVGEGVRLETRPEMASHIQAFHNPPKDFSLSPASLETLAIIAFQQPITRGEIEAIRGVKAEKALYTLKRHEFILEVGRRETLGRPILYGTGQKFLEVFGIESLEDLPSIEEFKEVKYEEEC